MNTLQIIQLILAVALIITVLMQNRGGGLSGIFGGSSNVFVSKRGMEKKLFVSTIVISILFFIISLANVIL